MPEIIMRAMLGTNQLYKAVRLFAVSSPAWDGRRIVYHTKPDERHDLTLVSQRVYGNHNEFVAVMAAAGLDRYDDELTEREIILPDAGTLAGLKKAVSNGA